MLNILIVDDEKRARKLLEVLLIDLGYSSEFIFTADSALNALKLIKKESIDIILLDIEMPEYSGLEFLSMLPDNRHNFEIIFTTAYSEYAINAFKLNAIDYLLKPIDLSMLKTALEKVNVKQNKNTFNERLKRLENYFQQENSKISIPTSDGNLFLCLDDILFCKADRMYTDIYTKENGKLIISRPLKFILDKIPEKSSFIKCHRSYLINKNHIKMYSKADGGFLVMDNNELIPISRDKKNEILKDLNI